MAEERIVEVETPTGATHSHTTVITDGERSGSTGTWVTLLVVVLIAAVAIWFFAGMNRSEVAKDNAIAEAANEVGEAAHGAGQAVEEAARSVGN